MTLQDERLFTTWFTSAADGRDHAVTDEEAGRGFQSATDPEALCGDVVTPVPLTTPPGPRCHRCELYLRARHTTSDRLDVPRHRHRKLPLLRRLFSHPTPARSTLPPPGRAGPKRRRLRR